MQQGSQAVNQGRYGYYVGVFGVVLLLFWLGIYKFTPTEAGLIEPLVANHFAMSWLYDVMSVQMVSNLVGLSEILVAIAMIVGLKYRQVGYYAGIAGSIIFLSTLSFLFTTPDVWKVTDGVLIANFFLVKDILFLAISISMIERNRPINAD
ncbi:DUF417 family protein [Cobetia sp. D5]|uniref:DUF417 family protein n=1 Tax=Cobetia sp. D5 TaxID=3105867 RepID=UPI002D787F71|nr:DUF417 family protein [Cobetia sp. D5]